jgi:hypothetical protein
MADLLLEAPDTPVVVNPVAYIKVLRKEYDADIRPLVPEYSSVLVAAFMRDTGDAPPIGLFTNAILEF